MKFVRRGKFTSVEDLPKAEIPENAICYEEPDSIDKIAEASIKYSFLMLGLVFAAGIGKQIGNGFEAHIGYMFLGWVLSFLVIIPHELLHGICYPKSAVVEIWTSVENGILFVTSDAHISRGRYIWMSIFPTLLFGIIPVIAYIFVPETSWVSMMFGFGAANISHGGGDFLNIHNTLKQVPAGAMVANSGIHTYWWKNEIKGEQK